MNTRQPAVMHQGAPQLWRRLSVASCAVVIAIALSNLAGWAFGVERLTTWLSEIVPLKITGSIAILAIAAALLRLSARQQPRPTDRLWLYSAGTISLVAGLYSLIPNILDRLSSGSISLRPAAALEIASDPFRIPISSGLSFLLLAGALWFLPRDWDNGRSRAATLSLLSAANALLTILGYAYGVGAYFTEQSFVPMPLPASVAFLLLSFIIIVVQPAGGILTAVLSDTTTGRIARRLLPAAILIPMVTGSLHISIANKGLLDHASIRALESLLAIILLLALVLYTTLSSAARDVTAAKLRAQRDLEAENRRLLWELSEDMLAVANREGRFIEVNPAWTATLGWSKEELMSRSLLEFVHPDDRDATREHRNDVFNGEGAPYYRNRYLCKDGTYRILQWRSVLNPATREVFAVARDVTEMANAERKMRDLNRELEMRVKLRTRELETANRELESFSYAVSHDLRAPLRAIEGFSRMVVERFADDLPDQARHYLSRVRAGSTRMAEIIDGLLTLSRLSRGDLRMEEVDLSNLATEIVEDLRAAEPERKVDISIESDMYVIGDRRLLQSLLLNLISNAWKFTEGKQPARIEIGAEQNDVAEFFVRDNGAGFDQKHAGKLFTPFQRLHTVEEFDGTGLGLATVQRVVNRHGGFVRAEGKVGEGATFWFSLPASEAERIAHSINLSSTRADSRQGMTNDEQERRI